MAAMTKRVNIATTVAVRNITPPICGTYTNVIMTTGDILKLLCKRARVDEILPDGSLIRLNMSNYYKDNGAGLDAYASVNMDDKFNKNKDSKRNRAPIVTNPRNNIKPVEEKKEVITEGVVEVAPEEGTADNLNIKMEDMPNESLVPTDTTLVIIENATEEVANNSGEVTVTEASETESLESNETDPGIDTTEEVVTPSTNNTSSSSKKKKKK